MRSGSADSPDAGEAARFGARRKFHRDCYELARTKDPAPPPVNR